MYELKNGKVFTSKFVGTGPSSYVKRIYRAAVWQRFRNTGLENLLILPAKYDWRSAHEPNTCPNTSYKELLYKVPWKSDTFHTLMPGHRRKDVVSAQGVHFLGAFAKLRKATISCVMAVCPSDVRTYVCPHGTTRFLLGGFSWNLIFENFSKIYQENSGVIKIWQQ